MHAIGINRGTLDPLLVAGEGRGWMCLGGFSDPEMGNGTSGPLYQ